MNRLLRLSCILLTAASLTTFAASAHAQQGLNLSWSDCGTTGTVQKTFACTSNTLAGAIIVASAVVGTAMDSLDGEESVMSLQTNQTTLSAWWDLGTGGCRGTTAIASSFDFTGGPFTCIDAWSGGASGGMQSQPLFDGANRERFRTICAIPGSTPITGTDEYYFFKLTILGAKTTGNGSCAGCSDGACIVFNQILLTQPPTDPQGWFTITQPLTREYVEWQTGATGVTGGCPAATPTQNRTWGSVKSLYR